jgi:hypothetical protein
LRIFKENNLLVVGNPEEEGFSVRDRRARRDEPEPRVEPPSPPKSVFPDQETAGAAAPEVPPVQEGPELASLFIMFASSALVQLGEAADPATGKVHRDLAQARYSIDLLALLKEKTEGNRTPEESQLLEEILYDLQMRFIRAVGPR